jgi:hypothetical protein
MHTPLIITFASLRRRLTLAPIGVALLLSIAFSNRAAAQDGSVGDELAKCGTLAQKSFDDCVESADEKVEEMLAKDSSFWGIIKAWDAEDDMLDLCGLGLMLDSTACLAEAATFWKKYLTFWRKE